MKQFILGFLAVISLAACSNHGKKVKVEGTKGEVLYKGEGVTEDDAKKTGELLKSAGYFNAEKGSTVQVTKEGDTYTLRFVYDQKIFESMPGAEDGFKMIAIKASKELFGGAKVNIALASKSMKDFKTMPFDEAMAKSMEAPAPVTEDTTAAPEVHSDDAPADTTQH